ncbi:ArsR/SmtB family transcription factor [Alkalilacustris brevis]|uniref:ArsR/SmtB family transcription factor n=1 Tax=Alkalilacustris brevis TaxID=2026338 RepID=UPI001EE42F45|nr:metalloregulator ArsR/SmtB family transcription factor [Alkalilacustris brevis]
MSGQVMAGSSVPVDAERIASLAKALAHPARVRIILFLLSRQECIGGDIVDEVGLAQSTVSEHLRILKASGLVVGRIERPRICYSLDPAALAALHALLGRIEARGTSGGEPQACYIPQRAQSATAVD